MAINFNNFNFGGFIMKKLFISTFLAVFLLTGSAFAQDTDTRFTDAQKEQIVQSLTNYAQRLNTLIEDGNTLKSWFYSGFQAGGDNAIIKTISSFDGDAADYPAPYVDANITTEEPEFRQEDPDDL